MRRIAAAMGIGKAKASSRREQAFQALVSKFAKIQYLMEQRALIDVVEKAPVGICITNRDYVFEYVNPAYCRIYGYQYDELIGKPFTVVVPEEHRPYLMELHDRFMDQEYELEGEWEVVRKDGKRLSILANAAYVVDERMKPKKITFVLDRTEEKRALERTKRLLESVESARKTAHAMLDAGDEQKRTSLAEKLVAAIDSLSQGVAEDR